MSDHDYDDIFLDISGGLITNTMSLTHEGFDSDDGGVIL